MEKLEQLNQLKLNEISISPSPTCSEVSLENIPLNTKDDKIVFNYMDFYQDFKSE